MSLSRRAALAWLRVAAVLVVSVGAGAVGYEIVGAPPRYVDSATVMFSLPKSEIYANAYYRFAIPLITSSQAIIQELTSPQEQRRIRAEGRTDGVDLALVNLYSQQYPDYGLPLATLTAASPGAENARRTFGIAVRRLESLLAAAQAKAGVTPRNRIFAQILADTGPVAQKGSSKRVLAGLAVLALVAVAALWGVIDRWLLGPAPGRRRVTGPGNPGAGRPNPRLT